MNKHYRWETRASQENAYVMRVEHRKMRINGNRGKDELKNTYITYERTAEWPALMPEAAHMTYSKRYADTDSSISS